MSKLYRTRPGKYPEKLPDLEPGEIRGTFWSVKPVEEKYILSFISGALAGKVVTQEITEDEYISAIDGNFLFEQIARKYSIG